ncbi:LysR family transcriptional regulator [Rhodobium gokarnense]|uniref:LysR family nitrogen assimilation transcriptional regulator n=1 Tax=Rhodobium gokarnense TaxID=364296 RepID=A0ABT3HFA0_9HYPH|nr:LysR substrate-binding domain-containing protein [Rhodobium gokarnense]MCW2309077.1 LysR family nitrogen assimilation transcriptional regulator [Rhodobium gokarnense]
MDSRQLRYFAAIFEARSLSRASEALHIAPSALSHHLANLEEELATALFVRKPRGMQPTAAGERLFEHARGILRAIASAERDVRDAGREISGEVAVGMAFSAVKTIGVPLLEKVACDYPKLRLALSESLSGATLMELMASEIDLAMVYNPPLDPRLRSRPLLEERMVCIGRADVIGEADAPLAFDDLLDLPIILLRRGLPARAIVDDATLLKKLEARARLHLNSVQAITGSLLAGLGCVIATRHLMREHLEAGRLNARPIIAPELFRTLCLCELSERPATYARETVRQLLVNFVLDAIARGLWDARAIED